MKKIENSQIDKKIIEEVYKFFGVAKNTNGNVYTLLLDGKDQHEKSQILLNLKSFNDKYKSYNLAYFDVSKNAMFAYPIIPILYTFNKAIKGKGKFNKVAINFINQMTKVLGSTNGFNAVFSKKTNVFKELDSFYQEFAKLKEQIAKVVNKKKFIILIDKLDNCSSDYQYKLLEGLYSLFDNTNVIITLAYDKSKSTSSTKDIFNDEVDDIINLDELKQPRPVNQIGEDINKPNLE